MKSKRLSRPRKFLLVLCVAFLYSAFPLGCGVPGAAGRGDTFGVDFTPPQNLSGKDLRGAIVFVVDGFGGDIFEEMLEAGELPAIREYFVDRGLYVSRAVGNIPSVTMANLTSLATGRFPGHHGVMGVNWFDRRNYIWRNYNTIAQKNTLDGDYTAPNIYEQFPADMTVSIFFQPHRGATKFFENRLSAGPPFFFGWYDFVDRLTLFRFTEMMDLARERGQFPIITCVYLLAADFQAYAHGVSSPQYRDALRHTDRQIGRLLGDLKRAGLLDKIIIAFVSDHGLGDVKRHFDIEKFLGEKLRLHIAPGELWEETPLQRRKKYYEKYSAVLYGSGDRYWAICLRKPIRGKEAGPLSYEPWSVRPEAKDLADYPSPAGAGAFGKALKRSDVTRINLLDALIGQEPVDAVAWAVGKNRARVRTKGGEVEFSQPGGRGGLITYKLVRGEDPLGWNENISKPPQGEAACELSPRGWLEVTHDTNYPDLSVQILAYFRSPRAGDIAVFAAPGWDFYVKNRAGHGGLRPEDMHVPLLLAGPGVPHKRIEFARTVDLAPTLLLLLGKEPPREIDGVPLLPTRLTDNGD